jgi:hypothetical protein
MTTTIPVTGCASCPFFRSNTMLCTMIPKGQRVLDDLRGPPPDWCPLRTADRLVTLRVM